MELNWTTAAFEDGYQAFIDHQPIESNPFDTCDHNRESLADLKEAWDNGWNAMAKDYADYLSKYRIR